MARFIPTAALLTLAAGLAMGASTYGRGIANSDSAADAAYLAAPFLLCTVGAGASAACGAAAALDQLTHH